MTWNYLGNAWAVDLLRSHIINNEVRHAYLFCGPSGIGRRTLALQFAQALNCQNPPKPGEFCGECRTCRQIAKMQHTDLFISQSDAPGGILKIESIREIQHQLEMLPYDSKMRIGLLLRFEEANVNAQNALLKTLEEPPETSRLFLTSSTDNAVLPTIASRCEILRLRPMPFQELETALKGKKEISDNQIKRIAHLSCGRPGYALQLIEKPDEIERIYGLAREGIELMGANRRERFKFASGFKDIKKRAEVKEILQIWQSLFRDMMLLSANKKTIAEKNFQPETFLDLESEMNQITNKVPMIDFQKMLFEINLMLDYLDANVNLQLLMETILLDWPVVQI